MFSFSGQIYIRKKIAKYIDGQFSKWGGVEGRATSDSDSTLDGFGKLKGTAPFRTKLHESDDRTLFYIKKNSGHEMKGRRGTKQKFRVWYGTVCMHENVDTIVMVNFYDFFKHLFVDQPLLLISYLISNL